MPSVLLQVFSMFQTWHSKNEEDTRKTFNTIKALKNKRLARKFW